MLGEVETVLRAYETNTIGTQPRTPRTSAETESQPAGQTLTNRACFPDDARSTRQTPSNQSPVWEVRHASNEKFQFSDNLPNFL